VNGSTAVNIAINVIQIAALVLFAALALGYRSSHPRGAWLSVRLHIGDAYNYQFATTKVTKRGKPPRPLFATRMGNPSPCWMRAEANAVPGGLSRKGRQG